MNMSFKLFLFVLTAGIPFTAVTVAAEGGPVPPPETKTLTLQQAVQTALERSPEALIAEAQALRAREAVRESRSLNKPQVVAGTGLAYNNGFPLSIEGAAPSIFQVGATRPILSKQNASLIREAEQFEKAGRIGKEAAHHEVTVRTALAYYGLYQEREIVALITAGRAAADKRLALAEASLDAGKIRPVDVTMIENAVAQARQQLLEAREQENLAETELCQLTGLPEGTSIQVQEPHINSLIFETDADELYKQALTHVPGILQAEANLRAKEFHVEAEKGAKLPRVDIVGQYALLSRSNNYDDYFNRFIRNNYLIGLSIQVPILDGSRASARIAQSRQEVSEERYRLQQMKSDLKLRIKQGLSALRIARGAIDLARSEAEAAREMLEVNETLLSSGRISAQEIDESRMQLQQRELALISADQVLFQRKLELLHVVGSLVSDIQ